jgi:hypothetical protein
MDGTSARVVSVPLVGAGVFAELSVIRMFMGEVRGSRSLLGAARRPCNRVQRRTGAAHVRRAIFAAAALRCVMPAAAFAQSAPADPVKFPDEPAPLTISTDRPSFSDGTGFVPVGHFQLETGYTFTFRDRDEVETQRHNGPEVLGRIGLIDDRFELRVITSGYTWSRSDDGSGSGFATGEGWNDVSLGFKLKLLDQDGWLLRRALGVQTTLGVGSDNISNQVAEPTIKLIWSYDLGESIGESWKGLTLGGNANIAWPTTAGDRFTQGQGSIYLAFPIVDGLSGFAEYYVVGPNSKGTDAAHYVDVGGAYLLNSRVQLDARVGVGLNEESDNVFAGIGLSVLF